MRRQTLSFRPILLASVLAVMAYDAIPVFADDANDDKKLEYFEKHVRPILSANCFGCHSAETKPAGGLRVDDINGLLKGGGSGAAIKPGDVEKSLLLNRIAHDSKGPMPPESEPLTDEEIQILRQWVQDGAVWPKEEVEETDPSYAEKYEEHRKNHWAWQPVAKPVLPVSKNTTWAKSSIDQFVLSKLEEQGVEPVKQADRVSLLRRVTFDLTGLPPTLTQQEEFLSDSSSDAYEKLIDRLLESPAFGEHWARHWLDVARYGESTGPSRNVPYPHAWKYRDYVVDAVSKDTPFDQFLREQIAGDLLEATTDEQADRQKIATGFLALGVKDVNQRFETRFVMDNVDEQVDVVTRSVLGLTVSCARCHDHKFDPVPMTDYYALAGIFTSTENASGLRNQMGGGGLAYYVPKRLIILSGDLPQPEPEVLAKLEENVKQAQKEWDAIRGTPEGLAKDKNGRPTQRKFRLKLDKATAELNQLTDPAAHGLAAHGVRDGKEVGDTELRIRGEAEALGPKVPRGFLTAFSVPGSSEINPAQSGRLELAEWLTSAENPMTSRVAVNRVWHHLFGKGIVSTVDNFGTTGTKPTHPELLDHLASEFVEDGWSLKRLVRRIVLTQTYQLRSDATEKHLEIDPENHLLWRHSPRRLTADEVRDGILLTAGQLMPGTPQTAPVSQYQMREIQDNGEEASEIHAAANKATYRSIYLPQLRGLTPASLAAFDPVEQTLVSGQRDVTTVPTQALFILNSDFVGDQSEALAKSIQSLGSDEARIRQVYQAVLARHPDEIETTRALAFLGEIQRQQNSMAKASPVASAVSPQSDAVIRTLSTESTSSAQPRLDNATWSVLIQAIYGSAEFRYVR